jgi:hypothetical protein
MPENLLWRHLQGVQFTRLDDAASDVSTKVRGYLVAAIFVSPLHPREPTIRLAISNDRFAPAHLSCQSST